MTLPPSITADFHSSAEDVIEMMMAGATAVQVGAANLVNPFICQDIVNNLPDVMAKLSIESLENIIGISQEEF